MTLVRVAQAAKWPNGYYLQYKCFAHYVQYFFVAFKHDPYISLYIMSQRTEQRTSRLKLGVVKAEQQFDITEILNSIHKDGMVYTRAINIPGVDFVIFCQEEPVCDPTSDRLDMAMLDEFYKQNGGNFSVMDEYVNWRFAQLTLYIIDTRNDDKESTVEHECSEVYIHYTATQKKSMRRHENKERERNQKAQAESAAIKQTENEKKSNDARRMWIKKQLNTAHRIQLDFSNRMTNPEFAQLSSSDQTRDFQKAYPTFNRQHPMIMRYMIDGRHYNNRAFRLYLEKVTKTKAGDPDEFMKRQADYVIFLWKSTQKGHINTKVAQQIWRKAFDDIKKEMETFKDAQTRSQEIAAELKKEVSQMRMDNLRSEIEEIRNDPERMKLMRELLPMTRGVVVNESESSDSDDDNEFDDLTFVVKEGADIPIGAFAPQQATIAE